MHGPTNSYLTVIVVHSTMHLMHHNHCQITTTCMYMYIMYIHRMTFIFLWYIIRTCICAGLDTDAQGAQENIRLFDNIHEIFTEIL